MSVYLVFDDDNDVIGVRTNPADAHTLADNNLDGGTPQGDWYDSGPGEYADNVSWRLIRTAEGATRRQRIERHILYPDR